MPKTKAIITAVEGYVPEDVIDNQMLSRMVDTSDEWIMSRIGIKTRHILKGDIGPSDMAKIVVDRILQKKNIQPSEIDLIICCTVTPDMQFPATANIIADKCGIKNGFGFDINAGCSGFIYGITTGTKYIEAGFGILATEGTYDALTNAGIKCSKVGSRRPDVLDYVINGHVQLIINTPREKAFTKMGSALRRGAVKAGIPYITTLDGARAAVEGILTVKKNGNSSESLRSIKEWHSMIH